MSAKAEDVFTSAFGLGFLVLALYKAVMPHLDHAVIAEPPLGI